MPQLLMLGLLVFITALDQTVVVTALLPMSQTLGLGPQQLPSLSWVISGFLLGYVIVMPLMGRVGDIYGRRKLMLISLGVFTVGSILCVEAPVLAKLWHMSQLQRFGINTEHPALSWMIFARFIQAVGGGAVVPIALATTGSLFPSEKRSIGLGFISGVTEAGGALGPLYGAIILEKWPIFFAHYTEPWMWLFLLNIPLVAILCVLVWWLWPKESVAGVSGSDISPALETASVNGLHLTGQDLHQNRSIDWFGAILIGAALLCLSLGLSQQAGAMVELSTEDVAGHNPYMLAVAAVLFISFVIVQKRREVPLIPMELFKSRVFSASSVLSLLVGVVLIAALVNVPIYAYAVLGKSHLAAGLLLLRLTIMIPIGAFIAGFLVTHLGSRLTAIGSCIVMAIGCYLISQWTPASTSMQLTVATVVAGLGFGLALAPISTTALASVRESQFGIAAAISTSARLIGMILGLAALSTWEIQRFQQIFAELRAAPAPEGCDFFCIAGRMEGIIKGATSQAMAEMFVAVAVVSLLGVVVALFLSGRAKAV